MKTDYYEYDPTDPESWTVKEPPSRPDWIDSELKSIAGVNRHGRPNLRLVWGGTELSDRSENARLKYHAGWSKKDIQGWQYRQGDEWIFTENIDDLASDVMVLPAIKPQQQLGMPRWVIERWVSPEELEETNRFQNRKEFHDTEKILRDFPREGVYDAYFVVQNSEGRFRQIDRDVLHFIKMKWKFEQDPELVERMIADHEAREEELIEKREAELWEAAVNFDLRLPDEVREEREEYWAKHHDYVAEYQRMIAQT